MRDEIFSTCPYYERERSRFDGRIVFATTCTVYSILKTKAIEEGQTSLFYGRLKNITKQKLNATKNNYTQITTKDSATMMMALSDNDTNKESNRSQYHDLEVGEATPLIIHHNRSTLLTNDEGENKNDDSRELTEIDKEALQVGDYSIIKEQAVAIVSGIGCKWFLHLI